MTRLAFVPLLLVTIMVPAASAQGGIASCCREVSRTQILRFKLKSYYQQFTPACPIRAVVFKTLEGKRICSDPDSLWTKSSMAYLDGKKQKHDHAAHKHHRSHH
ncbi:monocyte chemotactic protein 1B-like [Clinocottus analis]|uniref:monocyte chemotactic protein 1B-like n=1 Tax=Clinocottus analis TaxID=304258 RepID=UPI0035C043D3